MNQRTKKLMTMHKALHPGDDVDRLYVSRKEGGRGFASIENSVGRIDTTTRRLHRKVITATRNNTDNTKISKTEIT